MISFTIVLTIIAFAVILSDLNGKWVDKEKRINYAHSIFGIFTICFIFLRVNAITFLRANQN